MKKILFVALGAGFLLFGLLAYIKSEPLPKNDRVYKAIKPYSPYYLEKRIGGLQIRNRQDEVFKEKPKNMEVFHRMDQLEREWGQKHLSLTGNTLSIKDNNGTLLQTLTLQNQKERDFVHAFYGL